MAYYSNNEPPVEFNNSGDGPLKVPGYGYPVDEELRKCFSNGISNRMTMPRLTVREAGMVRFMAEITEKPEWDRKIFDEEIVSKWEAEAKVSTKELVSGVTFAWCITELRDRAAAFQKDGLVRTLEVGPRCVHSEVAIPKDLQDGISVGVKSLLDSKDPAIDWHPGSNDQVLDIAHPSLFPFMYGKTPVLTTGQVARETAVSYYGQGEIVETEEVMRRDGYGGRSVNELWSSKFQWLPAEVKFLGDSGTTVEITSYINNIHPAFNQKLYGTIEKVIAKAIPAWNEVLMKDARRVYLRVPYVSDDSEEILNTFSDYRIVG